MTKGRLKTASDSALATQIRKVIGAGPNEPVEARTPQFTRPPGSPTPKPAPTSAEGFDALHALTDAERIEHGMRRWGEPEAWDIARNPELNSAQMLWLFPAEWYDFIPDDYKVVDVFFQTNLFKRGETDNDIRFGLLSYGILVRSSAV